MIEKLSLNQSYDFDVELEYKGEWFWAELKLSPNAIELTVSGQTSLQNEHGFPFNKYEEIICNDKRSTFYLYNLSPRRGFSSILGPRSEGRGFVKMVFEVECLIFVPKRISQKNIFYRINIYAESLNLWIGDTILQRQLLDNYFNRDHSRKDAGLDEFLVHINDMGVCGISYDYRRYYSSNGCKAGISFPPYFFIEFKSDKSASAIFSEYRKIYALLAFLIRFGLPIDKVKLGITNSINSAWLYYATAQEFLNNKHETVFYPIGKNLGYASENPELPLEIFNTYNSLAQSKMDYFKKYMIYKRREYLEERFLGFFRILEACCFKQENFLDEKRLLELVTKAEPYIAKKFGDQKSVKSFLRGLKRYNQSKYNTEKNIGDFFKRLPKSLTKDWVLQNKDIKRICKLRNDITHANPYDINEYELVQIVKFIEVLLILSLCDILKMPLEDTSKMIPRIDGYSYLLPNLALKQS